MPRHRRFSRTGSYSPETEGTETEQGCNVHRICYVHGIVNGVNIMNTTPFAAAALEKALAEQLVKLLRAVPWLHDVNIDRNPAEYNRAFDLLARVHLPRGPEIELWVDVRSEPRPSRFPYVATEREFDQDSISRVAIRVFAAPHISPRMAEICESHGWSWFDLAGNCRISIPEVLHLQHMGNPPVHPKPKPKANLGTPEASRVVRALLTPFYAGHLWTQRSMQEHCKPDISLGLVNKVVKHLQEESFVEPIEGGGFRLSDPVKLLFAWREAYRFEQHERHGYFTLLQGNKLRAALEKVGAQSGGFAAYAAFSAADFQAPYVRQPKTWLYISPRELDRFQEIAEAKPVESGENLVILIPSDDGVFFHQEQGSADGHHLPCTNPVQTYVDLWHCGGRGKEAAEAVLQQCLKPKWKAIGLPV